MQKANYIHTVDIHNTKAAEAFIPTLYNYVRPTSVIDIGCGLATWLSVFKKNGVDRVLGVDGNYVDQSKLEIPTNEFLLHDLSKPLDTKEKFDLAICLEVAEHLPEEHAETIIRTLIAASDVILFSAALKKQGGQNHINEQPFIYWVKLFNKHGYIVKDTFRKLVWENEDIDWWYRQNMFLVVKRDDIQEEIFDYYHPARYLQIVNEFEQMQQKISNFYQGDLSVKLAFKIFLKSIAKIGK